MKASDRSIAPLVVGGLLIIITGLPYLYAGWAGGEDFVFGGFLLNPLDGNSYLAKMRQGWQGSWSFRLPFTADPGEGAFLFMFYLFLGHLSRWLRLPLLVTFHLTRSLSLVFLVVTIERFLRTQVTSGVAKNMALVLAVFGSGLGWLTLPFGGFTVDFWVAEAYPFLSAYSNPHFPLGLSLMLLLLIPGNSGWQNWLSGGLTGLVLALVLPFGVVVGMVVLGAAWVWLPAERAWIAPRIVAAGVGSAGILVYDTWVVRTMPAFEAWNAQNLTPSPGVLNLLVSLSPALLVAVAGAVIAYRRRQAPPFFSLLWVLSVLGLMYLPFPLQRRLIMGLYLPVAALAVSGLGMLMPETKGGFRLWAVGLIVISVPTNLILLLTAWQASNTHASVLYLTHDEKVAMDWLLESTPEDALVLAGPETGMFIPGWAGRFVIYGHPFETVNAPESERAVVAYYSEDWGKLEGAAFVEREEVDYVFWGPRERALGAAEALDQYPVAFTAGSVTIYDVHQ